MLSRVLTPMALWGAGGGPNQAAGHAPAPSLRGGRQDGAATTRGKGPGSDNTSCSAVLQDALRSQSLFWFPLPPPSLPTSPRLGPSRQAATSDGARGGGPRRGNPGHGFGGDSRLEGLCFPAWGEMVVRHPLHHFQPDPSSPRGDARAFRTRRISHGPAAPSWVTAAPYLQTSGDCRSPRSRAPR